PINLMIAAVTYVFIVYVVPLPGAAPPASARHTVLIVAVAMTIVCWVVCELWGRHTFAPLRGWLARGVQPDEAERIRTVRLPLYEAGHTLAVWFVVAVGFGFLDVALGGSAPAGALIAMMVALGGMAAAGLSYLAVEWITRPA